MRIPEGFGCLSGGLHQDAVLLAGDDTDELASACIEGVPKHLLPELTVFIGRLLSEKTPAELKGLLNREKRDIRFGSKGAKDFLIAVYKKLDLVTA